MVSTSPEKAFNGVVWTVIIIVIIIIIILTKIIQNIHKWLSYDIIDVIKSNIATFDKYWKTNIYELVMPNFRQLSMLRLFSIITRLKDEN